MRNVCLVKPANRASFGAKTPTRTHPSDHPSRAAIRPAFPTVLKASSCGLFPESSCPLYVLECVLKSQVQLEVVLSTALVIPGGRPRAATTPAAAGSWQLKPDSSDHWQSQLVTGTGAGLTGRQHCWQVQRRVGASTLTPSRSPCGTQRLTGRLSVPRWPQCRLSHWLPMATLEVQVASRSMRAAVPPRRPGRSESAGEELSAGC
jgi:hypothetical protein